MVYTHSDQSEIDVFLFDMAGKSSHATSFPLMRASLDTGGTLTQSGHWWVNGSLLIATFLHLPEDSPQQFQAAQSWLVGQLLVGLKAYHVRQASAQSPCSVAREPASVPASD